MKVVVQKMLNLHLFGCLFLFSINFYISTACDKSLSLSLKHVGMRYILRFKAPTSNVEKMVRFHLMAQYIIL